MKSDRRRPNKCRARSQGGSRGGSRGIAPARGAAELRGEQSCEASCGGRGATKRRRRRRSPDRRSRFETSVLTGSKPGFEVFGGLATAFRSCGACRWPAGSLRTSHVVCPLGIRLRRPRFTKPSLQLPHSAAGSCFALGSLEFSKSQHLRLRCSDPCEISQSEVATEAAFRSTLRAVKNARRSHDCLSSSRGVAVPAKQLRAAGRVAKAKPRELAQAS